MHRSAPIVLIVLIAPAFIGCASAAKKTPPPAVTAEPTPERVRINVDHLDDSPIYFGFNEQLLDDASAAHLNAIATYMDENAKTEVTITGHADERGTIEYNLALGDKRARAARDYLIRLGVSEARVSIVSYGEEAPAIESPDEGSYALNRRDEFLFYSRLTTTAGR